MSDFDGIKLCEYCGNYATGRLCASCQQQEMIDHADDYGDWFEKQERERCKVCNGRGMVDDVSICDECDGTGVNPVYW